MEQNEKEKQDLAKEKEAIVREKELAATTAAEKISLLEAETRDGTSVISNTDWRANNLLLLAKARLSAWYRQMDLNALWPQHPSDASGS